MATATASNDWYSAYGHVAGVSGHGFNEDDLYAFPKEELDRTRPPHGPRVCIVGGGVAGLCAAYELAKANFAVTVLEASNRWGGRIKTQRFPNGTHAELGAMRIPVGHACTRAYIREFGLAERTFVQKNERGLIMIRDVIARACDVKAGGQMFPGDPLYGAGRPAFDLHRFRDIELPSGLRTRNPDEVLEALGRQIAEQFRGRPSWLAAYGVEDLNTPKVRIVKRCEESELWQYVAGIVDPRARPASWGVEPNGRAAPSHFYLDQEEWEYFGRLSSHLWLEKISLLQWLLESGKVTSGQMLEIEGGNGQLVERFVRRLRRLGATLRRRTRVVAIEVIGNEDKRLLRVNSTDRTGTMHSGEFEFAVVAVPAPAAARIVYVPALDRDVYEALTNISYVNLAKAAVMCSQRRWEQTPFRIAGGPSFTDLPVQQVWYPSDNARRVAPPPGWFYSPTDSPTGKADTRDYESPFWEPSDPARSDRAGALLSYMWGANARRFAALSDEERRVDVESSLERLHPGTRGDVVDMKFATWDSPDCGGGAVAMFRPGEQQRYQPCLARPHPGGRATARVFFAGEHLAVMHGWIQAAIQTGLAAVLNIFTSPLR